MELPDTGSHEHADYSHDTMAYQQNQMLTPPDSVAESSFSHFGEDASLAEALSNYQSCHDCTTLTTVPHHHHPPGRLAGASATLDGHFCCSWLLHEDQPCYLCFQSAEALDHHIKNDHAGKDGTYRCHWQICAKHDKFHQTSEPINFSNKPKLMRHVHSHTGYKPFTCPFPGCDKGFVTREQLKNHETTHTKTRRFKCDKCDKAFAVKSALTTHFTAVHLEEKLHKCEVCGKGFADSSNLSKHKQTHWRDQHKGGVRKQRSRRNTSSAVSCRSTPSLSTPSMEPATPTLEHYNVQHKHHPPPPPGFMLPPSVPKLPVHTPCSTLPAVPCCGVPADLPTKATASSVAEFDPNCFCCDQACPPPDGPATPCEESDVCDRDGFCDLPGCLGEGTCEAGSSCPEVAMSVYCCEDQVCGGTHMPYQWEDLLGNEVRKGIGFSAMELEREFEGMHGS